MRKKFRHVFGWNPSTYSIHIHIQDGTKQRHSVEAKYFKSRVKYLTENFTWYKGVILTYFLQILAQNICPLKSGTF